MRETAGHIESNESGMHSVLENLRGFLGFERPAPLITLLLLSNSYITSPKKATEYLFLLSKKIRKQDFTLKY